MALAYTEATSKFGRRGKVNLPDDLSDDPPYVGVRQNGGSMLDELGLTSDEKECLRMWFRQAIAKVEMEECKKALLAEDAANNTKPSHQKFSARRPRRSRLTQIVKQMEMA